jgi:hypothetical protein
VPGRQDRRSDEETREVGGGLAWLRVGPSRSGRAGEQRRQLAGAVACYPHGRSSRSSAGRNGRDRGGARRLSRSGGPEGAEFAVVGKAGGRLAPGEDTGREEDGALEVVVAAGEGLRAGLVNAEQVRAEALDVSGRRSTGRVEAGRRRVAGVAGDVLGDFRRVQPVMERHRVVLLFRRRGRRGGSALGGVDRRGPVVVDDGPASVVGLDGAGGRRRIRRLGLTSPRHCMASSVGWDAGTPPAGADVGRAGRRTCQADARRRTEEARRTCATL